MKDDKLKKPNKTGRPNEITQDVIDYVIDKRKAGYTWDSISDATGYSVWGLRKALKVKGLL